MDSAGRLHRSNLAQYLALRTAPNHIQGTAGIYARFYADARHAGGRTPMTRLGVRLQQLPNRSRPRSPRRLPDRAQESVPRDQTALPLEVSLHFLSVNRIYCIAQAHPTNRGIVTLGHD